MKVGIVTYLKNDSISEILQVWALKRAFEKKGCQVKIVNACFEMNEDFSRTNHSLKGWKQWLPFHPVRKSSEDAGIEPKNMHFKEEDISFFDDYVECFDKNIFTEEVNHMDLCVVTGEKTWSIRNWNSLEETLFLAEIKEGVKKAALGVGDNQLGYSAKERKMLKKWVNEFSFIGVVQSEFQQELQKVIKNQVTVIQDSTLLLRRSEYSMIKKDLLTEQRFILVDMNQYDSQLVEIADKVSNESGLPIYCYQYKGVFQNEVEEEYVTQPSEYLGAVEKADYVITNHFHGTVFALLFERQMLYISGREVYKRTEELLDNLGMKKHRIAVASEYKNLKQAEIANKYALPKKMGLLKVETLKNMNILLGISVGEELVDCPTNIMKKDCCGCYACKEICPHNAITMVPDQEGFSYPIVNPELCTSCKACEKVCVIREPKKVEWKPEFPKVYAAYRSDEKIRMKSTSGAIFPGLARHIILTKKGYVCGVRYDEDMNVVMDIADNMADVKKFYGSKYVKSDLNGVYPRIRKLLQEGQYVLFSGLPCECSALRSYLRKDYGTLYICEILCHAAPSPKLFKKYVEYLTEEFGSKVTNIKFRDKRKGWLIHQNTMVIEFADRSPKRVNARKNNYFRAFLNDYIARPSCSDCKFTYLERAGDITIGDYWGIQDIDPELFDNKGVSCVFINNKRGLEIWNRIKQHYEYKESTLDLAYMKNHKKPSPYRSEREEIFGRFDNEPIDILLEEFNDLKK
ncbi:Coenzyme F420 hydrogenase/dehydrogenase, beta subunit C-terminal domain [Anaeromicropila populeti]|uniref:Coenzyme F420-reducing hydrogenase, beta subunit n=1 Tax=Anaeromicropila populeti TaxID=37658 RepID=A0A1I6HRG1_9FIRM|nr:Coenzyme F420 hydrogenase/dehydrogenase, beta subunit C-terminal domain [Anaeromicropila populeti]SFR56860.1 Coenzyme F420-reducing hydrogenase, beta subunit [Anaeromicropila populeti]